MVIRRSVSLVFPVRNRENSVAGTVLLMDELLRDLCDDYEIIVVDDSSEDSTRDLLRRLRVHTPALKPLFHSAPVGPGVAIRTGLIQAGKDLIILAADNSFLSVKDVKSLLDHALDSDAMLICGNRPTSQMSLFDRIGHSLFRWLTYRKTKLRVDDPACALSLFHRKLVTADDIRTSGTFASLELVLSILKNSVSSGNIMITRVPTPYPENNLPEPRWHRPVRRYFELLDALRSR